MATDYFLKIDGIKGESKDAKHKGEIDMLAWSAGARRRRGTHRAAAVAAAPAR